MLDNFPEISDNLSAFIIDIWEIPAIENGFEFT